jgi:hypothetical protein
VFYYLQKPDELSFSPDFKSSISTVAEYLMAVKKELQQKANGEDEGKAV